MYKPLAKWTRDRLAATSGSGRPIKLRELTEEACEIFAKDPNFLRQEVYPIIAGTIQDVIAATRRNTGNGGRAGTHEPPVVAGQEPAPKIYPWREHTKAGWVLLTTMNRGMLKEAIGERKIQLDAGRRRVLFLEALGRGLRNNEETVGERYDAEQIESLRRRYEKGTAEQEEAGV